MTAHEEASSADEEASSGVNSSAMLIRIGKRECTEEAVSEASARVVGLYSVVRARRARALLMTGLTDGGIRGFP